MNILGFEDVWRSIAVGGICISGVFLLIVFLVTRRSIIIYYFFLVASFALHAFMYSADLDISTINKAYLSTITSTFSILSGFWFTYQFFKVTTLPFIRLKKLYNTIIIILLIVLTITIGNFLVLRHFQLHIIMVNAVALMALMVVGCVIGLCIFLGNQDYNVKDFLFATLPLCIASVLYIIVWSLPDFFPKAFQDNAYNLLLLTIIIQILSFSFPVVFSYLRLEKKKALSDKQRDLMEKETEKVLLELEGLASKNEQSKKMLAGLMHDIKTPIQNLTGLSTVFERSDLDEETKKSLLTKVKDDIMKTNKNIERMFSWARSQLEGYHPVIVSFKMREATENVLEELGLNFDKKNLVVDNQVNGLSISCDRDMFHIALYNLLTNAIKFSHENGKIEIGSEENSCGVKKLWVRDHGIGMTQERMMHLFQQTGTAAKNGMRGERGHGYGLHIVQDLLAHNNAKLFCESTLNVGTKFTIQFEGNRNEEIFPV